MSDKDDPPYTPRSCGRGRVKKDDDPVPEFSSSELSQGYRILQDIMGISKFFLEQPSEREKGMRDYYDVISKPMCFSEIKRKFLEGEYKNISEFVCDVRLMLLNCYRYFGPGDVHTKRALRLEQILEQKLALLPIELRNQCSLECTHGDLEEDTEAGMFKPKGDVESRLLQSVLGERSRREKERKQKLLEERRAEKEGKEREILLWEKEKLFPSSACKKLENMWELPVICHFVTLSLEQLNINSISIFEIERIFLMPEASRSLSILMTTLLSTPLTRLKLHAKPPMPYKIWTAKLTHKVGIWYKLYLKLNKDPQAAFEKLGVEPHFWKIMGNWNPLEDYEFHELTFHQRVTLIKALCDYILQNHKFLRDMISEKVEEFGVCLGEDRYGAKFIYFPQFLDQDIRVYRQVLDPKCWVDRDEEHQMELLAAKKKKCEESSTTLKKMVRRRRKSAWKRGKILKQNRISSQNSARYKSTSTISELRPRLEHQDCTKSVKLENSFNGTNEHEIQNSNSEHTPHKEWIADEQNAAITSPVLIHTNLETGEVETNPGLQAENENGSVEWSASQMGQNEDTGGINENSSDIGVSGNVPCLHSELKEEIVQNTDVHCSSELKVEPLVVVGDRNDFVVRDPSCVKVEEMLSFPKNSDDNRSIVSDIKPAVKRPLHNPYWLEPDPEDFKLVANSVEGVRQLLTKYCDNDLELIQLGSKKYSKRNRPSREVKLAHGLASLVNDLEPLELKLVTNTKRAREKLYKEYLDFLDRSSDFADPDEAFWLNEKEAVDPNETHMPLNSDILDDAEDLNIPITDAGGMTLRHRRPEDHLFRDRLALGSSEESTEIDSDESDNWVLSKNKKRKRTPKLKNFGLGVSGKKKQSAQEKQPSPQAQDQQMKLGSDPLPDVEILNDTPKSRKKKNPQITGAAIRAKKRLFLQNEASNNEASRQLEWEKNRQKLVNSAVDKVADASPRYVIDSANKIILDDNGMITIPSTNKNKALITLQGRKLGDIIKEGKLVKSKDVITDVIGIEMGNKWPQSSGVQKECLESGKINSTLVTATNIPEESNKRNESKSSGTNSSVNVELLQKARYNATEVQVKAGDTKPNKEHPSVVLVPSVNDKGQTIYVKVTGQRAKQILENVKKGSKNALSKISHKDEQVPVLQSIISPSKNVTLNSASSSLHNPSVTSLESHNNILSTAQAAPSTTSNMSQNSQNVILSTPNKQVLPTAWSLPNKTSSELVCISDDSDNSDVEVVSVVYNPKSDTKHSPKIQHNKSSGIASSALLVGSMQKRQNQDGSSPHQITIVPTSVSDMERGVPSTVLSQLKVLNKNQMTSINLEQKNLLSHFSGSPVITSAATMFPNQIIVSSPNSISQVKPSVSIVLQNQKDINKNYSTPEKYPVQQIGSCSLISTYSQPQTKPSTNTCFNSNTPLLQVKSPSALLAHVRNPFVQERISAGSNFRGSVCNPVQVKNSTFSPMRMPLTQAPSPMTIVRSPYQTAVVNMRSPGAFVTQARNPGSLTHVRIEMRNPATQIRNSITGASVIQVRSQGSPSFRMRNLGSSPIAKNSVPILSQIRSPTSAYLRSPSSSSSSSVQLNSGVPFPQTGVVNPHGASTRLINRQVLVQGRVAESAPRSTDERSTHTNQPTARLVVVPGDEKTASNYALVFPNGSKVILTPKQVADIRAANGGVLTTNVEI